jgi:hypothetical protein
MYAFASNLKALRPEISNRMALKYQEKEVENAKNHNNSDNHPFRNFFISF